MILLWCYYRPESSFTPFSFSLIREDQPSPTGRHVRPLHLADDDHDDDDHNRGDVDDDDCGDIDDDGGDVRSFQVSEEWFGEPDFRLKVKGGNCCSVSGSFFVNICVTLSDMKLLDGIIDLFWPTDDHLQSRFLWSHWGEAADRTVRSSDGSSNILSDHLIIWSSDILS